MATLNAFRVVFLGAEDLARGRTMELEAVDLRSASAQVKEVSPSREYLIISEAVYVARTMANRTEYRVNELYGMSKDGEYYGPRLGP